MRSLPLFLFGMIGWACQAPAPNHPQRENTAMTRGATSKPAPVMETTQVATGAYVAAPPDTAGVPVINWRQVPVTVPVFELPFHSRNFFTTSVKVRFDSTSIRALRAAHLLPVARPDEKTWPTDREGFEEDFPADAAVRLPYRLLRVTDREKDASFLMVANGDENRVYLFPEPFHSLDTVFVPAPSVLLVQAHAGNNGFWGCERECRMIGADQLALADRCWEYSPRHPRDYYFTTEVNVVLGKSGRLAVKKGSLRVRQELDR